MNTRRGFLTGITSGAAAGLLTRPLFAQTIPSTTASSGATALSSALRASMSDTFLRLHGDGNTFNASATATLRLQSAFYETQNETGEMKRDEAVFLSRVSDIRNTNTLVIPNLQAQLKSINIVLDPESLARKLTYTQAEGEATIKAIRTMGAVKFHRHLLKAIASTVAPTVASLGLVADRYTLAHPHLRTVQLDSFDCDFIKIGIIFGGYTGNPATIVLILWYYCSC